MWGEVDALATLTQPEIADFLRIRWEHAYATCFVITMIGLQELLLPRPRKTAWRSDITNVIWPHGVPQTRHNSAPPSLMDTAKSPRASPLWTCFVLAYMSRAEACLKSKVYIFGPVLAKGYYSRTRIRLTRCLRGAYVRFMRNVP